MSLVPYTFVPHVSFVRGQPSFPIYPSPIPPLYWYSLSFYLIPRGLLIVLLLILLHMTCIPVMVASSYIVAHLDKGSLVLSLCIPLTR